MLTSQTSLRQLRAAIAKAVIVGLGLIGLTCAQIPNPAAAQSALIPDAPLLATNTRIIQTQRNAHLEIDLSGKVEPHVFLLETPDRLIIDLPHVSFMGEAPPLSSRRALIKTFRSGLFVKDQSRVILDLSSPVKIMSKRVEAAQDGKSPARLVIDLVKADRKTFHAAVEPEPAQNRDLADLRPTERGGAELPEKPQANAAQLPLIVIDPGHGGPDSGAIGIGGIVEKTTVFNFALALKERLESSRRYRVMLTRDQDVFVPLAERMRLARAANAELFLSLHADTLSREHSVAGATVYTVSDRASDAEAARIAAHENMADQAGGLVVASQPPEVADILIDLTRRETRSYAHVFSKSLINAWKSGPFLSLNKNPQRAAGFVVLKAPDVPSVLLELGYLSSPSDAKALASDEWRHTASLSVLAAIDSFFTNHNPPKKAETNPADQTDVAPTASVTAQPHL